MPQTYNFTKEELEELYLKRKLSSVQIATQYGCAPNTVLRHLRLHNIPTRSRIQGTQLACQPKNIITEQQIKQLCLDYQNGDNVHVLADKYGICSSGAKQSVTSILRKNGMALRHGMYVPQHNCNEHYFDIIDTENKAYWLGFLAADGHIRHRKYGQKSLVLSLSSIDKHHIQAFLNAIHSNHRIWTTSDEKTSGVQIASDLLCEALQKYSIVPRKSLILKFPLLPLNLTKHYIRGYCDGDGNIGLHKMGKKDKRAPQITIVSGSPHLLAGIGDYLARMCNVPRRKVYSRKDSRAHSIHYTYSLASRVITYLYKDAAISLPRKQAIAQEIILGSSNS